jgi:hypothetical protein
VAHESKPAERPFVDIAIPCLPYQSSKWWPKIMSLILSEERYGKVQINKITAVSSALVDSNKNHVISVGKKRENYVDSNRKEITADFLGGEAEWIFWIDDDTAPPKLAITKLLSSGHDFISGLYYSKAEEHVPIALLKAEDGGYRPISGYSSGTIMPVDVVGMGCCLIHRSVYERIMQGHTLYRRMDKTLFAFPNSQIKDKEPINSERFEPYIENGILHEPTFPAELEEGENYPFYALANGRTEDIEFCELAAHVGIRPWVDTSVTCEHIGLSTVTEKDYEAYQLHKAGLL